MENNCEEIRFDSYEPGNWECYLFGCKKGNGILYRPDKRNIPNWFWRKMQYLCFGNRWVKINRGER